MDNTRIDSDRQKKRLSITRMQYASWPFVAYTAGHGPYFFPYNLVPHSFQRKKPYDQTKEKQSRQKGRDKETKLEIRNSENRIQKLSSEMKEEVFTIDFSFAGKLSCGKAIFPNFVAIFHLLLSFMVSLLSNNKLSTF